MDLYLNARQYNTSNSDNGRMLIDRCTPFASPHSFISLPGCIVFQGGVGRRMWAFQGHLTRLALVFTLQTADSLLAHDTLHAAEPLHQAVVVWENSSSSPTHPPTLYHYCSYRLWQCCLHVLRPPSAHYLRLRQTLALHHTARRNTPNCHITPRDNCMSACLSPPPRIDPYQLHIRSHGPTTEQPRPFQGASQQCRPHASTLPSVPRRPAVTALR